MMSNYDSVIKGKLHELCCSRNNVNKRLALGLLYSILTIRSNFYLMNRYVNDPDNASTVIGLLRAKKASIQLHAYDVFKIFVANPRKSDIVVAVLRDAKRSLISAMASLQRAQEHNAQFNREEADMVLGMLNKL